MEARVLLLVAAVAGAAAPRASANIALAGPYAVDVLEYAVCDDGEYPGVSANFSQVVDEETKETVYRGEFTVNYDLFADDSEVQITAYRWGSTGGWSRIFYHNFTEPYDYIKSNLPNIFELFWKKIGITEKPVTPVNRGRKQLINTYSQPRLRLNCSLMWLRLYSCDTELCCIYNIINKYL
ncbi:uncharacterized protein LOC126455439 isoform X2 [Schistocerca serialis cubense]|uniref:uncharacterized protein LOC126455439 isoform X2 n=1 Tax=Schistocerca serialis cubense TaxID=2023355 RepID=UPI00214DF96A|nr:uncharacterized protein LOC126455439 isoform X2 [Schistocerca serialis cubense]